MNMYKSTLKSFRNLTVIKKKTIQSTFILTQNEFAPQKIINPQKANQQNFRQNIYTKTPQTTNIRKQHLKITSVTIYNNLFIICFQNNLYFK